MGSRGGGRGRGRFGGGGFRHAKQEPFVLFPDIQLPAIDKDQVEKVRGLVRRKSAFEAESRESPYFIKDTFTNDEGGVDIERYSDKGKKRSVTSRTSLENCGFMTLQPGYFPLELVRGTKRRSGRKVEWNPKRDLKRLDVLLEREEKLGDDEDPGSKKKKGGEDDDDDDEEIEPELSSEDFSDGDYEANEQFDDDDDDYNQKSDHDDEGFL